MSRLLHVLFDACCNARLFVACVAVHLRWWLVNERRRSFGAFLLHVICQEFVEVVCRLLRVLVSSRVGRGVTRRLWLIRRFEVNFGAVCCLLWLLSCDLSSELLLYVLSDFFFESLLISIDCHVGRSISTLHLVI